MTGFPIEALSGASGFRSDPRFTPGGAAAGFAGEPAADRAIAAAEQVADPIAAAFGEGYAAGLAQAREEAAQLLADEAMAREALALGLARIDAARAEQISARLRETVAALCEAALAPLAFDPVALAARAERAAGLFAEADGAVTIHLHPEDVVLVAPALGGDWKLAADPTLARGAIRVESADGGVEDGPAQWRRAVEDAIGRC